MSKRRVANPLALAVLGCLHERPMHPYEMAATMRERGVDQSIRLNYGSLYSVIGSLCKHALIEPRETQREGNRPERTIYGITDAGQVELTDWLSELLEVPVKEYTQFEAGLALIAALSPAEAVRLLRRRCELIEAEIKRDRSLIDHAMREGVPRLFLIEAEYKLMLRGAELDWVRALAEDIESGQLQGVDLWRSFDRKRSVQPAD